MKKKTKKLLLGTGIAFTALGALGALSYKITEKLVEVAMHREPPKVMIKNKNRLTGGSKFGSEDITEMLEMMDAAEEKLQNSGTETVEIKSRDGLRLVGHWKGCENPKRAIVAMHGWRSSWTKDFGLIADFWNDNDCCVLYAEQRAQGNSEGDYITFGLMERYDCLDWVNWVNEKLEGKLPIYLGGVSMGATTILMTAGLELPERVKGIVADCGFTSPHDIWKYVVANNLHISYTGLHSALADRMSRQKTNLSTRDYSTVDAMRECKVPVLLIHGTDDKFVPIEMTYENYKACNSDKYIYIVPGAKHGMSYLVDKVGYERKVKKFWEKYD